MKKFLAIAFAMLVLITLAVPAFAAEEDFVPSISYKEAPEANKVVINRNESENDKPDQGGEEDVSEVIVFTSILQAQNQTTDITQEERDALLDLYEEMKTDEVTLPLLESGYVVRELFDISWSYTEAAANGHEMEEWLSQPGNTVTITLYTGVPAGVDVVVTVYVDGHWKEVPQVSQAARAVQDSSGTVTCVFEEIGPVAICVQDGADIPPAQTGDLMGRFMWLWMLLLIASVGALIVLVRNRRKFVR